MNTRKLASLFQFRFRTLFVVVAFVALAITALMNATPAWSFDLYCAAIALITLAIPLACYRSGEKRAFWAGFALCGWVYLLVIGNIDDRPRNDWSNTSAAGRGPSANIPTSRLTHWIYRRAYGDPAGIETAAINVNTGQVAQRRQEYYELAYLAQARLLTAANDPSATTGQSSANAGTSRTIPAWWDFLNVGHALWTIVLACVGGLIVRGIYILRPEEK
jgi:hypothetical protein